MAIVRWAPFDLTNGVDDMVRRTFGDFGSSLLAGRSGSWAPALDVYTEGDELHVRLEIPGIDPDQDVQIEVQGGVLQITGERKRQEVREGEGWYRREMSHGRFERHIGLPEGTDPEALRASYDAGILDISVPLPTKQKTTVKVEVANKKELKE